MYREPYGVGSFVHVIQRGARGLPIVRDKADRDRFLFLLAHFNDNYLPENWFRDICSINGIPSFERPALWPEQKQIVRILGFCLLTNHFHLLLEEVQDGGISKFMQRIGTAISKNFNEKYEERGAFTDEYRTLLSGTSNGKLKITKENAGYLLNLFWALGLASKNPILDSGEMQNKAYGGAGNFASTGGWTLAASPATGSGQGDAMEHYSRHMFFALTPEQQALVDKISSGIYRPCCNNSTHFPDCNHGMAMLGLLELMASQGVSEANMWKTALSVNSYWFPDQNVKDGDKIVLYTKSGVSSQRANPNGSTTFFYYWGLSSTVFNNSSDTAALLKIEQWEYKTKGS